jgi:hypothetical protein
LKLSWSLLVFSHYVASLFLHYSFVYHDIMYIMNVTTLTFKVVQTLFAMIRELQTEIAEFKVLWTLISVFSQDDNMNLSSVLKSEKFSDSLMFSDNWKKLCLFITKLCLKLERNADWFSTNTDKISYKISWLKENAAAIIDLFYWNDVLTNLNALIKLLEMIYDDINWKYMILIRLETCWQMNCEFINFYSEFLALMSELNWNENMKIAILWRTIFNKVWSQLMNKNMSSIFVKFIVLYQWIDEDLYLNQASWYR